MASEANHDSQLQLSLGSAEATTGGLPTEVRPSQPPEHAAFDTELAAPLPVFDLESSNPLPEELLPARWPGAQALALTREAYRALAAPSINYVTTQLERGDGLLPPVDTAFKARFQPVAP